MTATDDEGTRSRQRVGGRAARLPGGLMSTTKFSHVDSLGEAACLVKLQLISDSTGALGIAEMSKHIGFAPHRLYFITDVQEGVVRGAHAHRSLRQCFICLRGGVTVDLEKLNQRISFRLDDYGIALILPAGYWRELREFTDDALLVVLASAEYDEADYIRDYDAFHAWEANCSRS